MNTESSDNETSIDFDEENIVKVDNKTNKEHVL